MAEFPCFSIPMEAATRAAAAASLIGLSSSSRTFFWFSSLPRKSVRVCKLERRNRFRSLLFSKPNPDLDLLSSDECPDGSIIFHFGHRTEIIRESEETEKSKVSTKVSDEVASTEAIMTEAILAEDQQDQILTEETQKTLPEEAETSKAVDGEHNYGTTKPVHDNLDKSKELTHDEDLNVESDTIGSAAVLVTGVYSKAAVGPDLDVSSPNDMVNQGNNIISESQFDASAAVADSGRPLLDKKVNNRKDIFNRIQVDASTVVSSTNGAQLDHNTSEADNIISKSQVDTAKEGVGATNEAELDTSTMVSNFDGSLLNTTSNEQISVISDAEINASSPVSSLDDFQLDESIKKEINMVSEVQFSASNNISSSDGYHLDGHVTVERSTISEVQFDPSTFGSSSDGSQFDDSEDEKNGVIGEAHICTSTIDSGSNGSRLNNTTNEENNVIVSSHPTDECKEESVQIDVAGHPIGATDSRHNPENLNVEDIREMLASTSSEAGPALIENASHDTAGTTAKEDLTEGSLEEAGVKDEVYSADSAKTSQASMEESGYAETDTNREEVFTTEFCLSSGAASLPHPSKALTGGKDAYFIADKWLGVADGACEWSMEGVKTGLYAQKLLENSKQIMSTSESITDPIDLIVRSTARTVTPGLSTVLLAYFKDQALHVANIGDTGFMVIRNGIILKRSTPMVHEFNFPVQIEAEDDPLEIVESYKTELDEGDVIVFATDGMFDNLYEQEIVSVIQKSLREGLKPQDIANILATRAHEVGSSACARSPFADEAHAAGYVGYTGGKLDDVTVIVSLVERNSSTLHSRDQSLHLV